MCEKSFTQKSNVKTHHMLVHTGKKDFQCEVCESTFSRKLHLVSHMLTHTKVKAHKCDIGYKKFSQKGDLVKHVRIHLGEQPYGCSDCEKWFTHIGTRDTHIRSCHKELSSEQQSELKCKIPRSIVHDYLNHVDQFC